MICGIHSARGRYMLNGVEWLGWFDLVDGDLEGKERGE